MNIELVRGEAFPIEFTLKDENNETIQAEEIVVTCRRTPYKESPILFQKKLSEGYVEYDDGKYMFFLEQDDTKNLEYGTYGYDIMVIYNNLIEKFVGNITIKEEYNNEYSVES